MLKPPAPELMENAMLMALLRRFATPIYFRPIERWPLMALEILESSKFSSVRVCSS